jgi:hypothetical protein
MKMSLENPVIPETLERLWSAEDELRGWSSKIIAQDEHLCDFLEFLECYMDCIETARPVIPKSDRHFALGALFLRTFDDCSHALRAATTGNYRGSAMYLRDLLETDFLIDYLMSQDGLPEKWLHASDEEIRAGEFSPSNVRIALDKRDGFTARKRRDKFDLLSKLGVHPSPKGLELQRDGTRFIGTGPFKHAGRVKELIEECERVGLTLSGRLCIFCREVPNVDAHPSMRSRSKPRPASLRSGQRASNR